MLHRIDEQHKIQFADLVCIVVLTLKIFYAFFQTFKIWNNLVNLRVLIDDNSLSIHNGVSQEFNKVAIVIRK